MERIKSICRLRDERNILLLLKEFGVPKSSVEVLPELFANRKPDPEETYYYYTGPQDDKNREFCALVLKLDKVFSLSDIEIISRRLNYSVFTYKGSYNCRHHWARFRGKIISTPEPTANQIRSLINKGIVSKK